MPSKDSLTPEELHRMMRYLGYRSDLDMAKAIGVSRSSISLWRNGRVGVPRPVCMLLRLMVQELHREHGQPNMFAGWKKKEGR